MRGTESQAQRRARKAQARRYRQRVTEWLNGGRSGPAPQPKVWFPELPSILTQAGILPTPPVNFYIPQEELTDEENRYEARLAENRVRYASEALASEGRYRPSNRADLEVRADGEPALADELDALTDQDVEYEMTRVRAHAENIRRRNVGKPELPVPPPRLRIGSREWWEASGLPVPSIEGCRIAAFRRALRGELALEEQPEEFQLALARWVGQQE